eukprot:g5033.t1
MNVGQQIPRFTGTTQVGEIDLHDYIDGGWCVIVTQPAAFDAIHTTEFGHLAKMEREFEARHCKLIGVSICSLEDLDDWLQDVNLLQGCEVNFPVIADEDAEISRLLGVIANDAGPIASRSKLPVSTVIIIDIDKNIQAFTGMSAGMIKAMHAAQLPVPSMPKLRRAKGGDFCRQEFLREAELAMSLSQRPVATYLPGPLLEAMAEAGDTSAPTMTLRGRTLSVTAGESYGLDATELAAYGGNTAHMPLDAGAIGFSPSRTGTSAGPPPGLPGLGAGVG